MRLLRIPRASFWKKALCCVCSAVIVSSASAQNAIKVTPPHGAFSWLTRDYRKWDVPPINLQNSERLESLIRAGNLYLNAQDVIALALENNLDIEIQRYGPILYRQVTKRTRGGGVLRSVGMPVAQGPQSVSLTGVSLTASGGTATASTVSGGGGIVTSLGPTVPLLDPQLVFYGNFGHYTSPLSNTIITGTNALVQSQRVYEAQYSQYNDFGTYWQLTYVGNWNKFNSQFYNINPYNAAYLDFQFTQNLLYGFGRPVLARFIRVAKNNEKVSDLQFKQQVITTIAAVLNLYWDLVSFNDDLKARKDELATAQALYDDNKKQVQIGTLAPIEVTRAEAQVYSAQQDLLVSQTNLSQQEIVLKNALSKNGVASPTLADVHVVPLDTFSVPEKDELKPLDELVREALANRVEIAQLRLNVDSDRLNLAGVRNELKPTLQVFADVRNSGLAGSYNVLAQPGELESVPFLTGGYGTLVSQIFQRNFPTYSAGISLNIPLRNRAAQSDYVTSALTMRQDQLNLQKQDNQVRVDVQNAVIGLRQARVRYDSAVKARILQQQTLDADKKKYALGASTVFQIVTDQQNLATAASQETQALANYSHARIAFDVSMGTTLDVNHVSIQEALAGRSSYRSVLPEKLPAAVGGQ